MNPAASCRARVLLLLGLAASGCRTSDYGTPCPSLLDGAAASTADADPTLLTTAEVVGQGPDLPCEQLTCIASDGAAGYCSGSCLDDRGCPPGFECRIIEEAGPFAGERYCAWKRCARREDCGRRRDFCCRQVAGVAGGPGRAICAHADARGRCP